MIYELVRNSVSCKFKKSNSTLITAERIPGKHFIYALFSRVIKLISEVNGVGHADHNQS